MAGKSKAKRGSSQPEATETRTQPLHNIEASEKPRIPCIIRLRNLHPEQQRFANSRAKRRIIKAGRRGGKTTGMADIAATAFMDGHRVLYATPTADQIKRFWSEVTYIFAEPIEKHALYKNESEHIIEVPGQKSEGGEAPDRDSGLEDVEKKMPSFAKGVARIRAKTAWNADTLRGDYADVLILDEWQLMNEDAWEIVGAPMLIDNNGVAIFCYTPPSLKSRSVSKAKDKLHARKMYQRALADKTGKWEAFHFTSYDNPYLSEEGLAEVTADMTKLAVRQEIMGEELDEVPGALWTRELIEKTRLREDQLPTLVRIVVGIDPSGSATNEAGICAAGIDGATPPHGYLIRDKSLLAPSPKAWASTAVNLYHELRADRICGERNYGGDMVKETVLNVDQNVSYKDVNATRGKVVRAEPITALYERGLVHHVGEFPELEDEMCSYVPGDDSPNRMDAAVWCFTELMPAAGALGLLEYLKSGAAEAELNRKPQPPQLPGAVSTPSIAAIVKPGACPECGNEALGTIAGGQMRCQQCGVQWWPGGKPSGPPQQNRASMLSTGALR